MVYRYTAIAAAVVVGFALIQLTDLLQPTTQGPPWQLVVIGGLALGIAITWSGLVSRLNGWVVVAINVAAAVVVSFRIATPETTTLLMPTGDSVAVMQDQMSQAFTLIRNGIEPVLPVAGLVVIVTLVMWTVGALATYGIVRHRPSLAVIPGLVLVLQFATMDRTPTSLLAILAFTGVVTLILLAVAHDERSATAGRMSHTSGVTTARSLVAPGAAIGAAVLMVGTLTAVTAFDDRVPYDGHVRWRAATGLTGDFFGGVSYNPFVSIQQSLVTQSDTPLFLARLSGENVESSQVYFRLLTMETYQNGQFFADRPEVESLDSEQWENAGHAFVGPTSQLRTDIQIDQLEMDWLPAAYTPIAVAANEEVITNSIRVRGDDGSIILEGGVSYPEMLYSVTSDIPQPDLAVLVANDEGELSPMFAAAAETSDEVPEPVLPVSQRPLPADADAYLALPDSLDEDIAALAQAQTAGLETDFERGVALEAWFRSNEFTYTTDIPAGHGATDVSAWLLVEDSPFYRAGYCENFATSMAVMARTLGIPSRVVLGFTPGEEFEPDLDDPDADPTDQYVVVRDRNAHAWVELWMPSQGWVRFDPTPRPDQVNPATTGDLGAAIGFDASAFLELVPETDPALLGPATGFFDPGLIPEESFDFDADAFDESADGRGGLLDVASPVLLVLLAALILIGGVPALKWWKRRQRRTRLSEGDIAAAWEDIVATLTDYGAEPAETLTPSELAASVDPAMEPLAEVYGDWVYGPHNGANASAVATALRSLDDTTERLQDRHSRTQKLKARYRPTSLFPSRLRKLLSR